MRLRTGTRAQPIACRCARWKGCWRQRAPSRTVGYGSHGSTISHSKAVKISVFTELKTHKYRFLRSPCLVWAAPPKPVVATLARRHSSGVTVMHQVGTEGCTRTKSRPAILPILLVTIQEQRQRRQFSMLATLRKNRILAAKDVGFCEMRLPSQYPAIRCPACRNLAITVSDCMHPASLSIPCFWLFSSVLPRSCVPCWAPANTVVCLSPSDC